MGMRLHAMSLPSHLLLMLPLHQGQIFQTPPLCRTRQVHRRSSAEMTMDLMMLLLLAALALLSWGLLRLCDKV